MFVAILISDDLVTCLKAFLVVFSLLVYKNGHQNFTKIEILDPPHPISKNNAYFLALQLALGAAINNDCVFSPDKSAKTCLKELVPSYHKLLSIAFHSQLFVHI